MDRVQGPKGKERTRKEKTWILLVRWWGLFAKRRKERRVAARGRGWERKTARGFLGFGG